MRHIDGLPRFSDCADSMTAVVVGSAAIVHCERFVARIDLASAQLQWLVERAPVNCSRNVYELPRKIHVHYPGPELWVCESGNLLAELIPTECGAMNVCVRDLGSGELRWEQFVPIPQAADWAEKSPAWPGASTEEIYGFLARDAERLVVCLYRSSRREMVGMFAA